MNKQAQWVRLFEDGPAYLTADSIGLRTYLDASKDFPHPMFTLAKQFVQADVNMFAAPCWVSCSQL